MTENGVLTIGYIGNGKSVNRYHIPYVLTMPDKFRIKAVYSRNHEQDTWHEVPGIAYTGELGSLLCDPEIDIISVNTGTRTHFQFAKQVLLAGKHCLVEKPFTESESEARELFALARERGLTVEAYQNRRFDSDYLTVKRVLASGRLGELTELESHYDYYRPEIPMSVEKYSIETSYVYNHACHTLDQVLGLFGIPERVHYDVRQLLGPGRMNDYFDVDLFYDGFKASVKSSYFRIKPRPKFTVYGRRGMFVKQTEDRQEEDLKRFYMPGSPGFGEDRPDEYGTLVFMDENDTYHEEKVVTEKGSYAMYYSALYDTVANGAPPLIKPEETVFLMRMLEEATKDLK